MGYVPSLRRLLRSLRRSVCLLLLLIAATIDGHLRRPRVGAEGAIWIHGWCRRIVKVLNIKYRVRGELPRGGAVVSNHLSYLDILLYSAATPFVMVAKRQLRAWPLLGWLTAQAGTIYVDRSEDVPAGGTRQTHAEVNSMMAQAFDSGLPVLFFPEGTTTDGTHVLPFRRGLFHSVLDGGVPMRTAALRFELGAGNGTATVAADVCFIGEALFGPHIFRCLGLAGLKAEIRFGDALAEHDDRFALSHSAQVAVAALYESMEGDATMSDSSVYESGMVQLPQDLLY